MEKGNRIKLFCEDCQLETNHNILEIVPVDYNDEETGIFGGTEYMIVQCCGCERISFATSSFCSEDVEYDDNDNVTYPQRFYQYPKPRHGIGKLINDYEIPHLIYEIYKETCNSIINEDNVLAGVGLRTIIEAICKYEKISGKILKSQITMLFKKGVISKTDCDVLHGIRFMGNEAAHKISSPTKEQLLTVTRIVENLLENKYSLQKKSYKILDMPFSDYNDFYEYVISNLRELEIGKELCIDGIWEKAKKRYYDESENEYNTFLEKCKTDIRSKIDSNEELYVDFDNKYFKKYEFTYDFTDNILKIFKKKYTERINEL